jgi:outer membrane protein assembly factor BamA
VGSILVTILLGAAMLSGAAAQPEGASPDSAVTAWTVLPAIFYTPETGTGGGMVGSYFFKRRAEDRPSSVGWVALYTQKKQAILGLSSELYFSGGSRRLLAEAGFQDFPDVFYGVGPGTTVDDEEDYSEKALQLRLTYEREIRRHLRVGPQVGFRRSHVTDVEEGGRLASGQIPGVEEYWNTTVGLAVIYDNRDNIVYTTNGPFLEASIHYSGGLVGSDYRYSRYTLDLRRFFRLGTRQAIGARAYVAAAEGIPPFQVMPSLGGMELMRGYAEGRFRDKLAYVGQAEYRLKLGWRLGLAVFAALGDVAGGIDEFSTSSVKYSGGSGLRFRLNDEGFNLRLDFGLTEDGSGFYVVGGEAL